MRVTSYGAARRVTGSCHLAEGKNNTFLIDCGMYQGSKSEVRKNYEPFQFDPTTIDFMIVTHAHIDHCGLVPKLVSQGFHGAIYCSSPTASLLPIMLMDSAHIQEQDTMHENTRRQRKGLPPRDPLYTQEDVEKVLPLITPIPYKAVQDLGEDSFLLHDAGHIIGSSIVEYKEGEYTTIFSGDIGQWDAPIVEDPTLLQTGDYVYIESTYGNSLHESPTPRTEALGKVIQETYDAGGKLYIPCFALERTQEILFSINKLIQQGKFPDQKVYLDSPLAIKATQVFRDHTEVHDEETRMYEKPFDFPQLVCSMTVEDSISLNKLKEPAVIIAGSGMCNAGRIRHHLKHGLWDPKNTLLFVGYQAHGTLGRIILDGHKMVKMMGIEVAVRCRVDRLESFSAHGDRDDLIHWLEGFNPKPKKVVLIHGDSDTLEEFRHTLERKGFFVTIAEDSEPLELYCENS